jgi:hypothetical protein
MAAVLIMAGKMADIERQAKRGTAGPYFRMKTGQRGAGGFLPPRTDGQAGLSGRFMV